MVLPPTMDQSVGANVQMNGVETLIALNQSRSQQTEMKQETQLNVSARNSACFVESMIIVNLYRDINIYVVEK